MARLWLGSLIFSHGGRGVDGTRSFLSLLIRTLIRGESTYRARLLLRVPSPNEPLHWSLWFQCELRESMHILSIAAFLKICMASLRASLAKL